ncbi:MAG TPA: hypothetical protein DCM40_19660 [Maribacter sp.]|nr:hypothetical protein [Maribacter sp.]
MATSNISFSPKEFKVLYKFQADHATSTAGTGMYQLDVDSISMPSLGTYQSAEVRSGDGRTMQNLDFYQDNKFTVKEMTFTGKFHLDTAHKLPLYNILNVASSNDAPTLASGFSPNSIGAGDTGLGSHELFTFVIAAPSVTNGKNIEIPDCVCTNYTLSADTDTDGGCYKFSMTFASGSKYQDLDDATNVSSPTEYANTTLVHMSDFDHSSLKVADVTAPTMKSFSVAVDHPAVFVGASAGGYQVTNRSNECAVTYDAQVKYDDLTDLLISAYDLGVQQSNGLDLVTSVNFDINVKKSFLTNCAFSEGDIMMLDVSGKATDDTSNALVEFDFTS